MPSTQSSVAIFSYIGHDVRTVTVDGAPWFVVKDVALILGILNARQVVSGFDRDDVSATYITDSLGRPQTTAIINESGLYELVFQSRKPEAKQFRKWVTHVVLPEIRQTGSYVAPVEAVALDLESIRKLNSAVTTLLEHNERISAELAQATPRAEAWDAIASAEGDYSVGDAAKILARAGIQTGPQRLFNDLARIRWTYRGADNAWRAYADRVEKGYLAEKPSFHYHPATGERVVDPPQVRVTVKGIERLRQRLHVGALAAIS